MITIWKFPFEIEDSQVIEMPKNSQICKVGLDPLGISCIWAIVDTTAPKVNRTFMIFGTGHQLPENILVIGRWMGTFNSSQFVWHVFEKFGG